MTKFNKARDKIIEREFSTYQFKVPHALWKRFKIKSLTEKSATYRETLIGLIERYVHT